MNRAFSLSVCLLLTAFVSTVLADDKFPTLTVDGTTYTNVTVFDKNVTDVFIKHSGGMATLKLKDLSPELQAKFGYNPEKASAAEKKRAEDNAAYQSQLRNAPKTKPNQKAATTQNSRPAPAPVQQTPKAGSFLHRKAPELFVEKWLTKQPDTTGKFVLIDFWATWCGPCRQVIPELNQFHKKYADKLVVIGISDETEREVRAMKDPKINYSMAIDTESRTAAILNVRYIPHIILVDPNGILRWEPGEGNDRHLSDKRLQQLMAEYGK